MIICRGGVGERKKIASSTRMCVSVILSMSLFFCVGRCVVVVDFFLMSMLFFFVKSAVYESAYPNPIIGVYTYLVRLATDSVGLIFLVLHSPPIPPSKVATPDWD